MATTKCPVCGWKIENGGQPVEHDGSSLTVCCDECARKVLDEPTKYAGTQNA